MASAPPIIEAKPLETAIGVESSCSESVSSSTVALGPGAFPGVRKPFRSIWWLFRVLLGIAFLLPLLAGLAAFPVLNVVSLGMLLDAESQVARTGRLRDGFPLLPFSSRIGTIGLMVLLFLIPIMMISSLSNSQEIIKQLSGLPPGGLHRVKVFLQVLIFGHLLLAIANGGSFSCFLRPIKNLRTLTRKIRSGQYSSEMNVWSEEVLRLFKPWQHFKLAIKGAVGALCWLVIPTLLLGVSSTRPYQEPGLPALASFLGGALLIPVAAWLPLLQCHQATTGRFKAIFEVRVVREIICRVPIRWAIATILLYALAVPLYLSKVVVPPADAFWLFTPLFIIVIYPTRLIMGWVYGSGMQKQDRSARLIRWPAKVFMVPLLGVYALILFAVPLVNEAGPKAMFQNHAFLLPGPANN